jgi:hypothetical protein
MRRSALKRSIIGESEDRARNNISPNGVRGAIGQEFRHTSQRHSLVLDKRPNAQNLIVEDLVIVRHTGRI